jgi:hypothetical protein
MYLGPSFQCVRELAFEKNSAWARLAGPSLDEPAPKWILPWLFLDGCFQAAGSFLHILHQTVQLPQAIQRLNLGRSPSDGEICLAHLQWVGRQERQNIFNFTLAGANGDVILEAEGYRTIEVVPRKP